MLQRAVAVLLQRLLGKVVLIDPSMLRLSLWQGDLSFTDLQLRLSHGEGSIGQLDVQIPWRALWTQPVIVRADHVSVLLHRAAPEPMDPAEMEQVLKAAVSDLSGEFAQEQEDATYKDDSTYLSRLVTHILSNIQVEINTIQVRYDCVEGVATEKCSSATLEVGCVSMLNVDSNWEMTYTPYSSPGAYSQKLIKVEDIAAYIEYKEKTKDGVLGHKRRDYLFHEWFIRVKAVLHYDSANASFPDVDLDVEVGCNPGEIQENCQTCASSPIYHTNSTASSNTLRVHDSQPRIHFEAQHIDILYEMLMEVKAPYDQFERLSELSQKKMSRPEGFVMVLTYAKQWLMADIDAVSGEKTVIDDDEDDDEDEFEDAITPPTLVMKATFVQGASLVFSSRQEDGAIQEKRSRMWLWELGRTSGSLKQSCVDDEISFQVDSLDIYEAAANGDKMYTLFHHEARKEQYVDSPLLQFSCVLPAYESRLVGHQPEMDLQLPHFMILMLEDETITEWMSLFAPLYQWWKQWTKARPSKSILSVEEQPIAPISNVHVRVDGIRALFSTHKNFGFGVEVSQLNVVTDTADASQVQLQIMSRSFSVFSAPSLLENYSNKETSMKQVSNLHRIVDIDNWKLRLKSSSRTNWHPEVYTCRHNLYSSDSIHESKAIFDLNLGDETPMYTYDLDLPPLIVHMQWEEVEALAWTVGKWSFFMPDPVDVPPTANKHRFSRHKNGVCQKRWNVSVPQLEFKVGGDDAKSFIVLKAQSLSYRSKACSTNQLHQIAASTISLEDEKTSILSVVQHSRMSRNALDVRHLVRERDTSDVEKSGMTGPVMQSHVFMEQLAGTFSLPSVQSLLSNYQRSYESFSLGLVYAAGAGYDRSAFASNIDRIQLNRDKWAQQKARESNFEHIIDLTIAQDCQITIVSRQESPPAMEVDTDEENVAIGSIDCSNMSAHIRLLVQDGVPSIEAKGSMPNFQITDLALPVAHQRSDTFVKSHPRFVGSHQDMHLGDLDITSIGVKNTVDFAVMTGVFANTDSATSAPCLMQVRLDAVCIMYLHRICKQYVRFVADHVVPSLENAFTYTPNDKDATLVFERFGSPSRLPSNIQEIIRVISKLFPVADAEDVEDVMPKLPPLALELFANELTFALPQNSFSKDSIVLHCTNARMWSAGIDPDDSFFLQSGMLNTNEGRLSHSSTLSDATHTRAQQSRRMTLRNLRRSVKNHRSRILSSRSQLYVDLKNATQQAQNYLHEGFEALPEAEEAVSIIRGKIKSLDEHLESLEKNLHELDDAIEDTRVEHEAFARSRRESSGPYSPNGSFVSTTGDVDDDLVTKIQAALKDMPQHIIAGPLFAADDAEFHDARAVMETNMFSAEESTSPILSLFEFEIVDISGITTNASSPLFHHALLTGRLDFEAEELANDIQSAFLGIHLGLNELSVGATQDQYAVFVGMIFENFREASSVVNEDTFPLCDNCGGHHFPTEACTSIWMHIPIKVADAALRISNGDHAIADLFLEQLELSFTLRTDDSLELEASALSAVVVDISPSKSPVASELLRPLAGEGLQVEYKQWMNWTDSAFAIKLNHTNMIVIFPTLTEIMEYFTVPVLSDTFIDFGEGFMMPPPPDWAKLELQFDASSCLLSLLENFGSGDSRALVILANYALTFSTTNASENGLDLKKLHFMFDQRGVYFSQLPHLQIDALFPLCNAFSLTMDHFLEGMSSLHRRNSFALAPVEARFSVQDAHLFINIVNNYIKWLPDAVAATQPPPSSKQEQVATRPANTLYTVDKLLGDVGEFRLVLVNNSLGIPIADFRLDDILCEYVQDDAYSTEIGGVLSFNYFNNSIYRWEPLIEPFFVHLRALRSHEENAHVEILADLPNTVNVNVTPAMAPLMSSEALKRADFLTTGSKSSAPFWIENRTGMEIKFSFRRGRGSLIQQRIEDEDRVPVDCREQGDMRSFDSDSADKFIKDSDRQTRTANHTLSVWLNDSKWVSTNPVIVDVVGHVSIPLREATVVNDMEEEDTSMASDVDQSPPVLVAEIALQPDGSKLISLHSQVVLQNRTAIPLLVWAFSPRDGGSIQEWMVEREQVCYIPLQLMHPQSKISIKPSPFVQYAPLATSFEELQDDARVVKSVNSKRFIKAGTCVCSFATYDAQDELQSNSDTLEKLAAFDTTNTLPGFVVRDLPTWKCTYDIEAYFLMRATFSNADEWNDETAEHAQGQMKEGVQADNGNGEPSSDADERKETDQEEKSMNSQIDEARLATQRRTLYEATNSSLFHFSISPFLTIHNRLATALAYRLLNESLQLVAEGVLAVGNIVPLFQVDSSAPLYISFRLENYNWSSPQQIINPKQSAYRVPYKELIEPAFLPGRVFDRNVANEQGNVPNLQLQVKLTGRDIVVFCSVWVVNHSNLDLDYCNSTSSSSKRLEDIVRYVHRPASPDDLIERYGGFAPEAPVSNRNDRRRSSSVAPLQKMKSSINPVALIIVVKEARELYNSQFFGSQSPYVRATLYGIKRSREKYDGNAEMHTICSATTRPSPSGGMNPKWSTKLHNTMLLRLPDNITAARVVIEVRNVNYGMDSCIGMYAMKLDSILQDRSKAAGFNWYSLIKRRSSKDKKAEAADIHRGDLCLSFTVGTSQALGSETILEDVEMEDMNETKPDVMNEGDDGDHSDGSWIDDDTQLTPANIEEALAMESQTPGSLPVSGILRNTQRQAEAGSTNKTMRGTASARRDWWSTYEPDGSSNLTNGTQLMDAPLSTRHGGRHMTPPSNGSVILRPIQIYLPHNRFASVVVGVASHFLLSDVFKLVCIKCGFEGVLDHKDFDFYEIVLPRFVSLRSAGRPEGDRWYGERLRMDSHIRRRGYTHGLHLCHKINETTVRLYDESSTASSHHMTPRSSVRPGNPAQHRPMPWGEVLVYGSGGKNWDVLRLKSPSSPWSDVVRLNRNAMGNSGVPQVITLPNERLDQDENSELRRGSQEIALWSMYGGGRFSDTIIATVVPRYILINRTKQTIKYRQSGVPQTHHLKSDEVLPFHWPSASRDKLLEVTLLHKFTWSGCFRINSLGTTYLKLRESGNRAHIYILQCQIEMIGGSVALVFREESRRFPPYRIDNMTSFRIKFKQSSWGQPSDFDEIPPRTSTPYAWDFLDAPDKSSMSLTSSQDPNFPVISSSTSARALEVRFMRVTSSTSIDSGSDKDIVETREYNLDKMASHRRIQLHRSLPSQLFVKPDLEGYLLKKDNVLKWNKKYFRLYDRIVYYFASDKDQELLGVIDLRSGSNMSGAGGVAIFEKAAEATSKGFLSINGFVSSTFGSIFGTNSTARSRQDESNEMDAENARTISLVQHAVALTQSSILCEASENFVGDVMATRRPTSVPISQKGFYVNGEDLVDFLGREMGVSTSSQASVAAQDMLDLGILKAVEFVDRNSTGSRKRSDSIAFTESKRAWYSIDSINLAVDDDSLDSEDSYSTTHSMSKSQLSSSQKTETTASSSQFSIITPTKVYELKAKSSRQAKMWIRKLRKAVRDSQLQNGASNNASDDGDETASTVTSRTTRSVASKSRSYVQTAKTYVNVRVRADGPTKVLELLEGGEEDFEDKEGSRSEPSSVSSTSPHAGEAAVRPSSLPFQNGLSIHVHMEGFGISCVNEVPVELVYAYVGGINAHYSRFNGKMRFNLTFDNIQMDNQTPDATFPKLLCPRIVAKSTDKANGDQDDESIALADNSEISVTNESAEEGGTGMMEDQNVFICADCKYRQSNIAALHFCCTWSNEQGATDYFEHCSFWLYPMITQLDEELLVSLRSFTQALAMSAGQLKTQNRGGEIRLKSVPIETMKEALSEFTDNTTSEDLNPLKSLGAYSDTSTSSAEARKVYFALLHIHPIEFDITFRSDVFQTTTAATVTSLLESKAEGIVTGQDGTITVSARIDPIKAQSDSEIAASWAIPSLAMHVPDLDNAPLRLNALMIEHAFGTSGDLVGRVTKYYTRQLWRQLHKIMGSFDFLGNPVGFLDHIGTGVRDFVYEPLEGLKVGGKGLSRGLAKGTASLVSNTVDGTVNVVSKISGTFGQGLATMSLDDHYQQIRARARRRHVRGIKEGLAQGSRELGLGVYEGVTGLVLGPMRGVQENGAIGLVMGTMTGIIGLPMKPVAGIFDFASRATQGVHSRSLHSGRDMRRVRRPRVFGRYNELTIYKEADTVAHELLRKTAGGKFAEEKIVFYYNIVQMVPGSMLTQEAREKKGTGNSSRALVDPNKAKKNAKSKRRKKLMYEVIFYKKKLGLDLETDFYCEDVTVKSFTGKKDSITIVTQIEAGQRVLKEGDVVIAVGDVDVRGIGFHETLALMRGAARPVKIAFESLEEVTSKKKEKEAKDRAGNASLESVDNELAVQLEHWLIVTEQRALYVNVGSYAKPQVEWMTPLRYIYDVDWTPDSDAVSLRLSVGVDSLPAGPQLLPTTSLKVVDAHEKDMNVFLNVMWHSFNSAIAEEQELWPSDTTVNSYLLKKGGFTTVRRWFVLNRRCLYYFSTKKELRGIIPLGDVLVETDDKPDALSLRISNASMHQPLIMLQMDGGQLVERVQKDMVLQAHNKKEFKMWETSLAKVTGKTNYSARNKRSKASKLEIGCRSTPEEVVAPLVGALQKAIEVFNTKRP